MNTIEIYLTSVGENQDYTQNFSFAELIKDFPIYQNNYQNIVLNINIPTSILPSGYEIAGVTTDTMGVAVKVDASSLARNGAIRQSKSFYLRYLKTWVKDNVEYAMFQRPFPQTFALYAGQGQNAPKLTINVVNIMNDTLEDPNPTVVSIITSQTCSLEIMPSTILDKDEPLDPSDLEEINARLNSIEEEQLAQNTNISTNAEDIDALGERVGINEDNIEELQDEVAALGGNAFTNDSLGLIKGSTDTGKISANEDGTGSVNGWNTKLDINQGLQNIGRLLQVGNDGNIFPSNIDGIKKISADKVATDTLDTGIYEITNDLECWIYCGASTNATYPVLGCSSGGLVFFTKGYDGYSHILTIDTAWNEQGFQVASFKSLLGETTDYHYWQLDYDNLPVLKNAVINSLNHSTSDSDTVLSAYQGHVLKGLIDALETTLSTRVGAAETDIDNIEEKIPSQASSSNQLADKDFVNSSINAFAAFYITKNAQGDPFATKAELNNATVFYSGGAIRTPTTNDYCIVLADESKQSSTGVDPTTRYSYQGNQWEFQYKINDTPLTAAQLATLNSGMTSADKTKLDGIQAGAEVNVQADWNQNDSSADDYIKNKPNIPAGVVVDTVLDATSNNAIANSAVTNAVNNLQSTKQNVIDSTHKISADNVDDTSTTNKFVTTNEKSTWNSKQNALTTAQQNAVNSGIDSTKVAQIGTNATDITNLSGRVGTAETNITNLQNNKVDEVSQAHKLYGTDWNGAQTTLNYDSGANPWDIVQRGANSEIYVPATPTFDNSAASKAYADTKVDKTNQIHKLYGTNSSGAQDLIPFDYNGGNWTIAQRNGTGNVQVALTPQDDYSSTSKQYVDRLGKYDILYQGSSTSGTYTISDISNYRFIIGALKYGSNQWTSVIFPASYIASELSANREFRISLDIPNSRYLIMKMVSTTSMQITSAANIAWGILWGVK